MILAIKFIQLINTWRQVGDYNMVIVGEAVAEDTSSGEVNPVDESLVCIDG